MFISVHLDAFLRIPKIFFHFFPAPSHSKKNEELIEVHLLPLVQAVVSADLLELLHGHPQPISDDQPLTSWYVVSRVHRG